MSVVVVGGGLSGLFTALELTAAGVDDVLVVEKTDKPGGVARTIERDGFQLEPAVGSVSLPHPHLSPILGRIGAEMAPASSSHLRYVFTGGHLVELPSSPRAVLAPVVPLHSKLRALLEPMVRRRSWWGDENLEAFCERRFGRAAGETLAWLMASGVYAGDPRRLSAREAFPMLVALEEEHGSVIRGALRARGDRPADAPGPVPHVPVGGMAALARSAADTLGDRYRGGFEVGSVRREERRWVVEGPETLTAESVVLACRPQQAGVMVDDELSAHLEMSASAPVVVVGLGGSTEVPVPPGFGALVGPGEHMVSLGVLFESAYAPQRAPGRSWLVKVVAGGATNREAAGWDTDRIVQRVGGEAALVLGVDLDASFIEVVRHDPGIPQYNVGHGRWLDELDRLLADRPGLHVTGWGYRGVGVARLATQAALLSQRIAAS